MRVTVLGGVGAHPTARQGCGGYLIEHADARVLVDPGYATFPQLLARTPVDGIDAVYVSHGHPDHCADLQPLLRARALADPPRPPLPVHAPPGSLDRLLAIDDPGLIDQAYELHEFRPGAEFEIGPLRVATRLLPHFVPNAGARFSADGTVVAYTGDTGPSDGLVELARDADLLIAEATYPEVVNPRRAGNLSTAAEVGAYAARAGARRVLLTHLWPGTDPAAATAAARRGYDGALTVATPGLVIDLS
ncbi:MBL fold metallo-hydrolase [Micromonospora sp. NPDC049559]|uniref:MBL fold metallo-hydrolase n=1 Tax=Micromonospora sp. NPDC049559 TaxID=3155923 RepID=UPI00341FD637